MRVWISVGPITLVSNAKVVAAIERALQRTKVRPQVRGHSTGQRPDHCQVDSENSVRHTVVAFGGDDNVCLGGGNCDLSSKLVSVSCAVKSNDVAVAIHDLRTRPVNGHAHART